MMISKLVKIALLILLSTIFILIDSLYSLASAYFYFLISFLATDIFNKKKIKLIHVWCVGFIYIILSEVFLTSGLISNIYALDALKFLITANNIILLGYLTNNNLKKTKLKDVIYYYYPRKGILFLLLSLVVFYVTMSLPRAVISFFSGRANASEGENFMIISVLNSMAFLLPSVILFYFYYIKKTSLFQPFLLSSPIFVILFMEGSRFPLLFSFLGFILTYNYLRVNKISLKNFFIVGSAILVLVSSSYVMKEFRTTGNKSNLVPDQTKNEYKDMPTYLSQYLSNEGVIDMTTLMMQHFSSHDHLYGVSSGFITYFWVPRIFWEDKPTMLGHWFIRQYRSGFGEWHSASFGFTGELFADFGYFSLIIIFFIGRFIKNAEKFQETALASKSYNVILGAMLFPYIFFFVRSPITSSTTFLGILFFLFVFKRYFFKEIKIINFK